jgi:hypothetical protein
MRRRDSAFEPIAEMDVAFGPTKITPASSQAAESSARSERKP